MKFVSILGCPPTERDLPGALDVPSDGANLAPGEEDSAKWVGEWRDTCLVRGQTGLYHHQWAAQVSDYAAGV